MNSGPVDLLQEEEKRVLIQAVSLIQRGSLAAAPNGLKIFEDAEPSVMVRLHEVTVRAAHIFYALIIRRVPEFGADGSEFNQFCRKTATLFNPPLDTGFITRIFTDRREEPARSVLAKWKWGIDTDSASYTFQMHLRLLASLVVIHAATFGDEDTVLRSQETLRDILGKIKLAVS